MVKISSVWDSTVAVLAGRAALLVPLAAIAFFLPAAGQNAIKLYGGASTGPTVFGFVYALLALILALWGQLAVIAIASDPATTQREAQRAAFSRVPAYLVVLLVLVGCGLVLAVPVIGALIASRYDFAWAAAATDAASLPPIAPGTRLFLLFYTLALMAGGIWISARLFLVGAVVLNERRAIGALGRSVALTRGLTLKLIGVALLFLIVASVATLAAQSVIGLVFRLALGPNQIATAKFMAASAGAVLSAAFTVVTQVFAARLYAAVRDGGMAAKPGA